MFSILPSVADVLKLKKFKNSKDVFSFAPFSLPLFKIKNMLILVPKYHPSLSRPSHCLFVSHHGSSPDKEGSLSFPFTEVIQASYPACIKKKQIV